MFSERTRWDRRLNPLTSALARARESGRELLDLTQSNPTAVGLSPPADLLAALADPRGRLYEPCPRGLESAREAVAADYLRRGARVAPEHIVLTASTSEAYAFVFKLLCDPGATVLAPRPSYPLFDYLARLEGLSLRHYPLRYSGGWHVDPAAFVEALTRDVRAVISVSPNNPTGHYLKQYERERIQESCAGRGVPLVSDEVFADFCLATDSSRTPTLAGNGPALTFALGGLSKSLGLPQLKLAWIAVSGPPEERDEALERLEIVADTYLSVGTPVQLALPGLLSRLEELQAPIRQRLCANLEVLRSACEDTPVSILDVEGGWSATLRLPSTLSDEQWALRLLDRCGVITQPGYLYDLELPACLVVGLLAPPQVFERGIAATTDLVRAEGVE